MKDLIERQSAIDAVINVDGLDEEIRCEMCKNPMHTDRGCDGLCNYDEKLYKKITQILDKRITPLPSVQPERKMGRWLIKRFGADAQCSECGTYFSDAYDTDNSDAFCRHCGAKMDGLKLRRMNND